MYARYGRTYTHADKLRATLAFAFLCSARLHLALASVQAREKEHINSFYTIYSYIIVFNMFRLHKSDHNARTHYIYKY